MKALMSTREAADYIGFSEVSLRNSRIEGKTLAGSEPPPHIKIGAKSIRYKLTDLDTWIEGLGDE